MIDLCKDDPDVIDPLRFLREREIVHFQRFGEALRGVHDKLAEKKKTQYVEYPDNGVFDGFAINGNQITANYRLGCFDKAVWTFNEDGVVALDYEYNFGGNPYEISDLQQDNNHNLKTLSGQV